MEWNNINGKGRYSKHSFRPKAWCYVIQNCWQIVFVCRLIMALFVSTHHSRSRPVKPWKLSTLLHFLGLARSSIIYYCKHMPCPPHYVYYIGGWARLRLVNRLPCIRETRSRTTRGCKLQNIGSPLGNEGSHGTGNEKGAKQESGTCNIRCVCCGNVSNTFLA